MSASRAGPARPSYNYATQPGGSVVSDGALHAPAQSTVSSTDPTPTALYSVSNLTFCFYVGSVAGTVYNDANQNATNDAGDAGLQGWTVRLYKGVTPGVPGGGTVVGTATSAADGSYLIGTAFDTTSNYRVCEASPAASGTWAQSQPLPSSPNICGPLERSKGYEFTPASASQSITGKDFGNVTAVPCSGGSVRPRATRTTRSSLQPARSEAPPVSRLRPGRGPSLLARVGRRFDRRLAAAGREARLAVRPDRGSDAYTVVYNDSFPLTGPAKTMKFCLLDPRTDPTGTTLQPPYQSDANKGLVLPVRETSCLITSTASADAHFTAFVFSDADGWRSTA